MKNKVISFQRKPSTERLNPRWMNDDGQTLAHQLISRLLMYLLFEADRDRSLRDLFRFDPVVNRFLNLLDRLLDGSFREKVQVLLNGGGR